jgi:hypothetical protein
MLEYGGDEEFTWFEPPEHNTIHPWKNESCIAVYCSSVGLT